ncbi:hypothetical protein EDEG_03708 [Edhazardia aedis USNM 41457]|uniref:Transmembrane protein n=1 Tax=Edhazardia aedis (strain USNM 41457) TaxID=1003232 RepID=J9DGR1_EDHAE|nr:hypothetical protein EDEG_03708 [Edhazardia aedis USNM 41457]|eukprot:EJW01800.1 hypothetical protein EDEG_03708 [Edhazardia aedis USNM 41457]
MFFFYSNKIYFSNIYISGCFNFQFKFSSYILLIFLQSSKSYVLIYICTFIFEIFFQYNKLIIDFFDRNKGNQNHRFMIKNQAYSTYFLEKRIINIYFLNYFYLRNKIIKFDLYK